MVRTAKAEGLPVTCEVTPHHLFLTEDNIGDDYSTALKVNPPLRTAADAEALIAGVIDGTVDAIVTDHAHYTAWEKDNRAGAVRHDRPGDQPGPGHHQPGRHRQDLLGAHDQLMGANQRAILGVERVALEAGSTDLTVIDPEAVWTVDAADFCSGEELRLYRCSAHRSRNRRVRRRLHHGGQQDRQ